MKNLYIVKNAANNYSFDYGNDSTAGYCQVTMRKTIFGWNIEVTELEHWDNSKNTTFLWIADTAREAVKDCLHCLRLIERRRAILKRV